MASNQITLFIHLFGAPEGDTHQLPIDPPTRAQHPDAVGEDLMAWLDESVGEGSSHIEFLPDGAITFSHQHGDSVTTGVARLYHRSLQ